MPAVPGAFRRKRTLKKCTVIDGGDPAEGAAESVAVADFDAIDAAEVAVARATQAVLRANGDCVGGGRGGGRDYLGSNSIVSGHFSGRFLGRFSGHSLVRFLG